MASKSFPILDSVAGFPSEVPWEALAPYAAQAVVNHSQSLERLAERGGLSWCELAAVVEGRPWRKMDPAEAARICLAKLRLPAPSPPPGDASMRHPIYRASTVRDFTTERGDVIRVQVFTLEKSKDSPKLAEVEVIVKGATPKPEV